MKFILDRVINSPESRKKMRVPATDHRRPNYSGDFVEIKQRREAHRKE